MITGPTVFAFGGGRDGTAALIECRNRGVELHRIQFADTGNRDAEKQSTYDHVDMMSEKCLEWFGVPVTWVRNDGQYGTLETECATIGTLPGRIFGNASCSDKYKHRPMNKDLKQWQPALDCWAAGEKVTRIIAYNANEGHRSHGIKVDGGCLNRFVLIEWMIGASEVRQICHREFGYVPDKSSCFFCPSMKPWEIAALAKSEPLKFARAVAMEVRAKPKLVNIAGLGRHWAWEPIGVMTAAQISALDHSMDIPCMCFDGEPEVDEIQGQR